MIYSPTCNNNVLASRAPASELVLRVVCKNEARPMSEIYYITEARPMYVQVKKWTLAPRNGGSPRDVCICYIQTVYT